DMLAVQRVERGRDPDAEVGDLGIGQGQFLQARQQRFAGDALHDDVGCTAKSPAATNFGTCGPDSRGIIICSISKPTMAAGSVPSEIRGTFITIGRSSPCRVTR